MTTDPQTDRPRALHLLEAANFLRDAHFRDGLSVQEIGAALRHAADEADPMVGSLARDGFGLDEIAAMPAPPTDRAGLRERIAAAMYEAEYPGFEWVQAHDGDREHVLQHADAVLSVLPPAADQGAVIERLAAERDELRTAWDSLARCTAEDAEALFEVGRLVGLSLGERTVSIRAAIEAIGAELRRMADEEQQPETQAGPGGTTDGLCAECELPHPCPTFTWATTDRDPLATWDLADDAAEEQR